MWCICILLRYLSSRAPLGVGLVVDGAVFSCAAREGKSEVFLAGRGGAREFAGEGVQHTIVCGGLCRVSVCIGLFALVLF